MTVLRAPAAADALARTGHLQRLLDVYGALLTDHQREACRLHLDEDWSFAELAESLGCSRSGAHDLVRRGLAQLEHFEPSCPVATWSSRGCAPAWGSLADHVRIPLRPPR